MAELEGIRFSALARFAGHGVAVALAGGFGLMFPANLVDVPAEDFPEDLSAGVHALADGALRLGIASLHYWYGTPFHKLRAEWALTSGRLANTIAPPLARVSEPVRYRSIWMPLL